MTQEVTIYGWATLGPSKTITLSEDESIEDISIEEEMSHLKDDLRDRGFSNRQIEQMHIELDYIEPNTMTEE